MHEYKPEDYGLTAEQIRSAFAPYIDQYHLTEKAKAKSS